MERERGKVNGGCLCGARRGDVADWTCLVRVPMLCLLLCMFVSFLAQPCWCFHSFGEVCLIWRDLSLCSPRPACPRGFH